MDITSKLTTAPADNEFAASKEPEPKPQPQQESEESAEDEAEALTEEAQTKKKKRRRQRKRNKKTKTTEGEEATCGESPEMLKLREEEELAAEKKIFVLPRQQSSEHNDRQVRETLSTQVQGYRIMSSELEDKIASQGSQLFTLFNELTTANAEITRANKAYESADADLKEAEKKIATAEAKVIELKGTIKARDDVIVGFEKQVGDDAKAMIVLQTAVTDLDIKVASANSRVEGEKEKTSKQAQIAAIRLLESRGLSEQLTEKAQEYENLKIEHDILLFKEKSRARVETDLAIARDQITAIRDQLEKFKNDVQRREFDQSPEAYTTLNPNTAQDSSKTPNLADEFATVSVGSTLSSVAGSDDGLQEENHAVEDDTVKVVEPILEPPTSPQIEIRTITKAVDHVIYVPFEVAAHNPIVCWLQSELNYLVLFSLWIHLLVNLASHFIRRCFNLPRHMTPLIADVFDVSLPTADPVGPSTDPTPAEVDPLTELLLRVDEEKDRELNESIQNLPPLEQPPDTREVIGDPIPEASLESGRHAHAHSQTAGASTEANPATTGLHSTVIDQGPRKWYTKILSPRESDVQSSWKTLAGFVFHLAVYYSIFLGYYCWHERNMWIAANDQTRAFVQKLLHNPYSNQSLLQWAASGLPEHWKHNMDVFVFKYFVEKLGLHANYVMPG